MDAYRKKRKRQSRTDATVNRELSIVRTSFHNARKRTPPKVLIVPYFPMVQETTVRTGFLTDAEYTKLRGALPPELRPLFVCAYITGIRKRELTATRWLQVEFENNTIALPGDITKSREPRTVPILAGDMRDLLLEAKKDRDKGWRKSPWVFNREGERIIDFRTSWEQACTAAGVPNLNFHDLRRTAVRNMRRAGVPQVVRMKISGHKTDSMERRYNIVDTEDLDIAREFMERRMARSAEAEV
jgi:integrase